nr:cytochrome P450 71A4-like [Solanum lycopersicum]
METDLEKLRLHSKCNVSWLAANELSAEVSTFNLKGSLSCLFVWTLACVRQLWKVSNQVKPLQFTVWQVQCLLNPYEEQYFKAVIEESVRLNPPFPIPVPRESMEDVKLLDYDIPAKTQVLINVWAIGRDPLSWDEPEVYRPKRFLNSDIDFRGLNFELIPFEAGRRGCSGIPFAIVIIELA